jgi:hypothetical protein
MRLWSLGLGTASWLKVQKDVSFLLNVLRPWECCAVVAARCLLDLKPLVLDGLFRQPYLTHTYDRLDTSVCLDRQPEHTPTAH